MCRVHVNCCTIERIDNWHSAKSDLDLPWKRMTTKCQFLERIHGEVVAVVVPCVETMTMKEHEHDDMTGSMTCVWDMVVCQSSVEAWRYRKFFILHSDFSICRLMAAGIVLRLLSRVSNIHASNKNYPNLEDNTISTSCSIVIGSDGR